MIQNLEEMWNQRNPALADELFSSDSIFRASGYPERRGPEARKELVAAMDKAFPDYHYTLEEVLAEGDKVVARWTFSATQKGEYMGVAATDKHAQGTGTSTFRISGGKIVEELVDYDALGFWQQLGAIPTLGQAKGMAAAGQS